MSRLKRTLLHPSAGGRAPNASPFMSWVPSVFFLPIIGTRVSFFVLVLSGWRLPAPHRFEDMDHEGGGDDRCYQVEDGHRQHQRDDHPCQEYAPAFAPPQFTCPSIIKAPQRHDLIVLSAEKIAVQRVKYKGVEEGQENKSKDQIDEQGGKIKHNRHQRESETRTDGGAD